MPVRRLTGFMTARRTAIRNGRSSLLNFVKGEMPPVSLYIPCYNVERFIARCIEGALAQTHSVDEILIIDDGCKDDTLKIAAKYPVRIIRHPVNKGLSAAR